MHVCPRLMVEPNHAARAARSTSASASTNMASQPDSSSVELTSRSPSRAASLAARRRRAGEDDVIDIGFGDRGPISRVAGSICTRSAG